MKSAATLKAEQRAKMRAAGLVLKQVWIHPKDWDRVQTYIRRVNKRRSPLSRSGK